jgi:uncharacterized protein YjbI with pentapeptide repeats
LFLQTSLTYADFAQADISNVDFTGATMFRANLHNVVDSGARIPQRAITLATDPELAAAQNWKPKF